MMSNSFRSQELEHLYDGVSPSKSDVVLDALCGDGFASRQLIGKVERIVGVDTKEKPDNFPSGIEYSQQSIEYLTFPDETFSLALAHTGFHHVGAGNENAQQQAANHLYRVLKPKGRIRLSDIEGDGAASRFNDEYVAGHGTQCRWLTHEVLGALLEKAGFGHINTRSVMIPWRFETWGDLEQGVQTRFRVTDSIPKLQRYGLVAADEPTLLLPFIYGSAVKEVTT